MNTIVSDIFLLKEKCAIKYIPGPAQKSKIENLMKIFQEEKIVLKKNSNKLLKN